MKRDLRMNSRKLPSMVTLRILEEGTWIIDPKAVNLVINNFIGERVTRQIK